MINWLRANNGSWTDPTAWDSGSEPGATDDVSIGLAGYYTVSLASAAAAASLTISDTNASLVIVDPGGTDAFSGNVTNAGFFGVDSDYYTNEGGSTVTVAATLTNTGSVTIGPPTGGLSGNSTLSVGALAGNGSISIDGSASSQASLIVASLAPQSLSAANLKLNGDALLQFGSGQIGTIAAGVFLQLNGPNALVADAGNTTSNSALMGLVELDGQLDVINGASIALSGDLANTNILGLDNDGFTSEGGSQVTIAGTLTNTGYVSVGSYTNGLSAASTLTVGALAGAGSIYVHGSYGSTPNQATLAVASAAPSSLIAANVTLDGDALLQFGSGQIGTIAAGVTTSLNGPNARIADAGSTTTNSALLGLVELDGSLRLINGGNIVLSGNLTNTGALGLDSDGFTGEGGSQLSVAGTLTNTGGIFIGPYTNGLGAATTLAVGVLSGTGSIDIHGSYGATPNQASLLVAAAAPTSLVASNITLDGDALLQFGSGQIGTIAAGVSLELNGPNARIADAGSATANSALVALVEIDGTLRLINGGSIGLSGNLTNTGALGLDSDGFTGEGGSVLTVAGTLTNAGNIYIGPNTNGIGSATTLSVGQLAGTGGINIHGSYGASPIQASLLVAAAAPTSLVASNITLDGDALLQFGSGQIGTIAAGVSLELNGPNARIADAGSATANSALVALAEIDGTLRLINGGSIGLSGNLTNTGALGLDSDGFTGEGGSVLTVAGTLTNAGNIYIGPNTNGIGSATTLSVGQLAGTGGINIHGSYGASPIQASLLVAAAAPTSLVASNITLDGDALLQFSSGQIGTIAAGVSLELNGPNARIADAGSATANSALIGLVELDGSIRLLNEASLAVGGNLTNTGFLGLDSDGFTSEGGSQVTIAGTLTDSGVVAIGPGTNSIGAASTLSTQALTATGGLYIHGSYGASPVQASLLVAAAAPASLVTSNVTLDGDALLQFGSGQIGTIIGGVSLELNGSTARIADSGNTASNSALVGLVELDGSLRLLNGASVAIAGNLLLSGFLGLDSDGFTSEGGSHVTIGGTLTDSGAIDIGPSTNGIGAASSLSTQALAATGGIYIHGSYGASPIQASLLVGSAAPSRLVAANVTLDGDALLQFASGQISIIAAATALELNGPGARIADVASPASSSALTGLGENDGSLRILNGESLAFAGNLLNTGFLGLDSDGFTSEGGSSVSVAGTLTNSGQVTLGPGTLTLSTSDTLTVNGLVNSGGINLYGSSTSSEAKLVVRGAAGNTGNLLIGPNAVLQLPSGGAFIQQAGTTTINGTLDGTVDLAGGALVLGPTDVINGTIIYVGTSGTLYLTAGATGTISNFALGDSIVLSGVTASQVTPSYSAATGLTTLTITLTNATTESITLLGDYLAAPFNIGSSPNGSTITTTATAGTAALAVLIANGTTLAVSNVRNTETLNLGTATLGGPALTSSLDVLNGALAPSDLLGGSFAISAPILFTNSGFGAFSSLAAGAEDTAPAISLSSAQLGTFNETIVLTPTDTTSSGIQTPLAVQTIDVVGTIVLPQAASGGTGTGSGGGGTGSGGGTGTGGGGDGGGDDGSDSGTTSGPTAVGWGDVHFITFDGLDYTLQGDGEFILSQSTVPGDSFQVQARMQPFGTGSSVSVLTMIAAAVGTDRVTFGINRSSVVEINGVATSLPGNGQELQLNGGTLRETGTGTYVINWNSGEQLTVQNVVSQLSISLQLAKNDGAGSIKGLLGSDSGQANDFALSNGTILSNITSAQLYGEYANSWRVTQASSLLDYGPGQTTGTFTDVNFPGDSIELSNLPASVVQSAAVQTGQAGIVNSAIAAEANLDVAATGDQSFLTSAQFAQSVGVAPTAASITPSAAVTPALGVSPEFGGSDGNRRWPHASQLYHLPDRRGVA